MKRARTHLPAVFIFLAAGMIACGSSQEPPEPLPSPTEVRLPTSTPTAEQLPAPLPTQEPSPSLVIQPFSGPIGTEYTIDLTHFRPNETVSLFLVFEDTGETVFRTSVTMDAGGRGTLQVFTEPGDAGGRYAVFAEGQAGSSADGVFAVVAEAEEPTEEPMATPSPTAELVPAPSPSATAEQVPAPRPTATAY